MTKFFIQWKRDIQSALKRRGMKSEEGGTGVAGRAHRTCSCRLRSTCEGDTTGSSCGGSCRWCTGWSPGRCNHFVLLKQRNDGQIRDEGEKKVPGWALHRTARVQELDYFFLFLYNSICCVRLTLDAPFEERFAALTWPDAVVVARGVVVAHGAVVEVGLPARRDHALLAVLGPPPSTLTNRQGAISSNYYSNYFEWAESLWLVQKKLAGWLAAG